MSLKQGVQRVQDIQTLVRTAATTTPRRDHTPGSRRLLAGNVVLDHGGPHVGLRRLEVQPQQLEVSPRRPHIQLHLVFHPHVVPAGLLVANQRRPIGVPLLDQLDRGGELHAQPNVAFVSAELERIVVSAAQGLGADVTGRCNV